MAQEVKFEPSMKLIKPTWFGVMRQYWQIIFAHAMLTLIAIDSYIKGEAGALLILFWWQTFLLTYVMVIWKTLVRVKKDE